MGGNGSASEVLKALEQLKPNHQDYGLLQEVLQEIDRVCQDQDIQTVLENRDVNGDSVAHTAMERTVPRMDHPDSFITVAGAWTEGFLVGLMLRERK